ncbi:MAG: gamma-glutamylcyclotransferase [bacterium]
MVFYILIFEAASRNLSIRAAIYGYQKEFYVWSTDQRGTDALPELVLEFESGVFCVGRAFRIL